MTSIRVKFFNRSLEKGWNLDGIADHETTRELFKDTRIGMLDIDLLPYSIIGNLGGRLPLSVKEYRYDRKTELWREPPKEWNPTAMDERYDPCSARLYIEPVHSDGNNVNDLALNDDLIVLEIVLDYPVEVMDLLALIKGKFEDLHRKPAQARIISMVLQQKEKK